MWNDNDKIYRRQVVFTDVNRNDVVQSNGSDEISSYNETLNFVSIWENIGFSREPSTRIRKVCLCQKFTWPKKGKAILVTGQEGP
jgi:hypothetical protein